MVAEVVRPNVVDENDADVQVLNSSPAETDCPAAAEASNDVSLIQPKKYFSCFLLDFLQIPKLFKLLVLGEARMQ